MSSAGLAVNPTASSSSTFASQKTNLGSGLSTNALMLDWVYSYLAVTFIGARWLSVSKSDCRFFRLYWPGFRIGGTLAGEFLGDLSLTCCRC